MEYRIVIVCDGSVFRAHWRRNPVPPLEWMRYREDPNDKIDTCAIGTDDFDAWDVGPPAPAHAARWAAHQAIRRMSADRDGEGFKWLTWEDAQAAAIVASCAAEEADAVPLAEWAARVVRREPPWMPQRK